MTVNSAQGNCVGRGTGEQRFRMDKQSRNELKFCAMSLGCLCPFCKGRKQRQDVLHIKLSGQHNKEYNMDIDLKKGLLYLEET
jgi:hypothetical protein